MKQILFLLILIIAISFTSAQTLEIHTEYQLYDFNQNLIIWAGVLDGTTLLAETGATCSSTIYNPDNSVFLDNIALGHIANGIYKNISFNTSDSIAGTYTYFVNCTANLGLDNGDGYGAFQVAQVDLDINDIQDTFNSSAVAIGLGLLILVFSFIATRINIQHFQTFFLIFMLLLVVVALRVYADQTGFEELEINYIVMLFVLITTMLFVLFFFLRNLFSNLINILGKR
jgi:lysylphosphatidylglycerol synthetase-like protein (DUF2156 family)